jgi:predicted nuclease of predicted toxin-antitoxin system
MVQDTNANTSLKLDWMKPKTRLIWRYAEAGGATIITKDEDFANRKAARPGGPQIVWIRVGNCSNRALLEWFTPLLPEIVERLRCGDGLVEVV